MSDAPATAAGPLAGTRVIEFAGLGPAPFGAMMLADLGAEVVRIGQPGGKRPGFLPEPGRNALDRGRRCSMGLDLKSAHGRALALRLVGASDVLIEGFRPGVMERLGLGPQPCLAANPRLVYARMTGWGQDGPLAGRAGHDINYLALTGALHAIGRRGQAPVPPLSLVGDYGGGGMLLVVGILAALLDQRSTGIGQVVDAAIVDGVAQLLNSIWSRLSEGSWNDARGENLLDSGAPFYDVYETRDGKYVAVGAIEPQFFENLVRTLELRGHWGAGSQSDRSRWDELRVELAAAFRRKTRDEWALVFSSIDACVSPVLSLAEAPEDPQNSSRRVHLRVHDVLQAAPAPRFSRFSCPDPEGRRQADIGGYLSSVGVAGDEIRELQLKGVLSLA